MKLVVNMSIDPFTQPHGVEEGFFGDFFGCPKCRHPYSATALFAYCRWAAGYTRPRFGLAQMVGQSIVLLIDRSCDQRVAAGVSEKLSSVLSKIAYNQKYIGYTRDPTVTNLACHRTSVH